MPSPPPDPVSAPDPDPEPNLSDQPTVPAAPEREATPEEPPMPTLPFDADKKRVIQSVLSVFETGKTEADYSAVVVLKDGAGITYGKHQSTDGGEDSLDKIVLSYIDRGGRLAADLAEYLPRLDMDETTKVDPDNLPGWVQDLMGLLAEAGKDPIMQAAQDDIFDSHYWTPAAEQAAEMKLVTPLAWLVCYDTTIQSGRNGIAYIRKKFPESPPSRGGDEHMWVTAYLQARHNWLSNHHNSAVRTSAYRTASMLKMVEEGRWDLDTPLPIQKPRMTVT